MLGRKKTTTTTRYPWVPGRIEYLYVCTCYEDQISGGDIPRTYVCLRYIYTIYTRQPLSARYQAPVSFCTCSLLFYINHGHLIRTEVYDSISCCPFFFFFAFLFSFFSFLCFVFSFLSMYPVRPSWRGHCVVYAKSLYSITMYDAGIIVSQHTPPRVRADSCS